MIFEGSQFEIRYNNFWNDQMVPADAKIKGYRSQHGFFAENKQTILPLLKIYSNAVNNLVSNLVRQADMFDDKKYIAAYIKATINTAVEDFSLYRFYFSPSLGERSESVQFINEVLQKLDDLLHQVEDPDDAIEGSMMTAS